MERTQNGLRKRICFVGKTNTGKSSLINAIVRENVSLVSEISGTTTDTVTRAYELLGYGPVSLCDTAGLGDETALGPEREKMALRTLQSCDLMILVRGGNKETPEETFLLQKAKALHIPFLLVYNKSDLYKAPEGSLKTNALTGEGIESFIKEMIHSLSRTQKETLLDGLVKEKDHVLLITPIDTAAPAGRLILPQVQVIRELLDKHVVISVVQIEELPQALLQQNIHLVITDSKVIKEVLSIVPNNMPVSTFSVLFAKAKGNFDTFLKGAQAIDDLQDGDGILMAEACVHTTNEDDIARVMIPKLIQKYTGKKLEISFSTGKYLPIDLTPYKLIIHCGSCMLTRTEVMRRIEQAQHQGVSITNYGLAITKCQMGCLERLTY